MTGCIFCAVVAGEAEASRVDENELSLAFLDSGPFNAGHTLVVPKRHAATLTDLTPQEAASLAELGRRVARALQASGLPCEGLNLWMANGEVAGQDVFHAHLHVIPRLRGDSLEMRVQWTHPGRGELESVAGRLRAALRASGTEEATKTQAG